MTQIDHDSLTHFLKQYCSDELGELARSYPRDSTSLWIDYSDMVRFDTDLADDLREYPEETLVALEAAAGDVDLPIDISLENVTARVTNVEDGYTYSPGEVRKGQAGEYVGVRGQLERVTSKSDMPDVLVFKCERCEYETRIPQSVTSGEIQEPYQCESCERQGPFKILDRKSEWSDYVKFRIEARPDADDGDRGTITGYALDDLVDVGGETGLLGRVGEPVTVYGIVNRVQKTGRGENELLFDHLLAGRSIEFDRDQNSVDVAAHREELEEYAARDDAVDFFAESIAPQLHTTDAWDAAMEFGVAYLFGAPRIDIPQGPTYRGDLHFLMVSDYGMGKSTFKEDIEAYSPKCLSKSTTALSSGVGLTAAAVKDDFGEGQWTIKPGLLVRANGGHLILDEIDKGPDELTDMNDALEGEQMVDIEKAGQSASYESRTGVMALGNPKEGRFNEHEPVAEQLGISESLLSRFDGIVTMSDQADEEQDERIAETYGRAYTEAQEAEFGSRESFDALERPVPIDVGRAWIKYAREEVNPILGYAEFEELKEWYASEVRQLNRSFAGESGDGADMPVPATVRELGAAVKMSIAFARVHLRDEVAPEDVERAKKLGKRLVKQNWDGEKFNASPGKKDSPRARVIDAVGEGWVYPSQIAQDAKVGEEKVRDVLDYFRSECNPPRVEEDGGKYRMA